MERVFTKDHGARYPAGKIADYPMSTWRTHFPRFEEYTEPLDKFAASRAQVGDEGQQKRGGKHRSNAR